MTIDQIIELLNKKLPDDKEAQKAVVALQQGDMQFPFTDENSSEGTFEFQVSLRAIIRGDAQDWTASFPRIIKSQVKGITLTSTD